MRRALFAVFIFLACKDEQPGEDTPYPGCEGVMHGQPCGDGACFNQDNLTVCQPKCESDSECEPYSGAEVKCGLAGFCELFCNTAADCPSGMLCSPVDSCAWPKD